MEIPMRRRLLLLATGLVLLAGLPFVLQGCASDVENRDPRGELFPSVSGESLEGETVALPEDFRGQPIVLLVGYEQDAQFDADRWMLGMMQGGMTLPLREVPTIDGLVPGLIAGTIDEGMRRGIPSEDWGAVVTVYGDADKIVEFTGNENGNNIRVLLLDADGRVVWYHDRGYSPGKLIELIEAGESLTQ